MSSNGYGYSIGGAPKNYKCAEHYIRSDGANGRCKRYMTPEGELTYEPLRRNVRREGPRRMNKWIEFVKEYANAHEIKYNVALSDPKTSAAYHGRV